MAALAQDLVGVLAVLGRRPAMSLGVAEKRGAGAGCTTRPSSVDPLGIDQDNKLRHRW